MSLGGGPRLRLQKDHDLSGVLYDLQSSSWRISVHCIKLIPFFSTFRQCASGDQLTLHLVSNMQYEGNYTQTSLRDKVSTTRPIITC